MTLMPSSNTRSTAASIVLVQTSVVPFPLQVFGREAVLPRLRSPQSLVAPRVVSPDHEFSLRMRPALTKNSQVDNGFRLDIYSYYIDGYIV
jgi:hypothetical protein